MAQTWRCYRKQSWKGEHNHLFSGLENQPYLQNQSFKKTSYLIGLHISTHQKKIGYTPDTGENMVRGNPTHDNNQ